MLLKSGNHYEPEQEKVMSWIKAYPDIDVYKEIDKMSAWLMSNPSRRKTERGMPKFINSWLSRANEQGGSPVNIQSGVPNSYIDVSWLDGEVKEMKKRQYLNQFGAYWDGMRVTR